MGIHQEYIQSSIIKIGSDALCVSELSSNSKNPPYFLNFYSDVDVNSNDVCESLAHDTVFIGEHCNRKLAKAIFGLNSSRVFTSLQGEKNILRNAKVISHHATYSGDLSLVFFSFFLTDNEIRYACAPLKSRLISNLASSTLLNIFNSSDTIYEVDNSIGESLSRGFS